MAFMTPEVNGARQELPCLESPEINGARQEVAAVEKYVDGAWQEVWSAAKNATCFFVNGTRGVQVYTDGDNDSISFTCGQTDWLYILTDETVSEDAVISFDYVGGAYAGSANYELGYMSLAYLNASGTLQITGNSIKVGSSSGASSGTYTGTVYASYPHTQVGIAIQVPTSTQYGANYNAWISISNLTINGKKYRIS